MAHPRVTAFSLSATTTGVSRFAAIVALVLAPVGQVRGQSVISTRSGIVHYFEGSVSVAGQPLERRFGRFPNIPEGAELRTEQGRAEVLLTPGTILRVGQNSAIRMASNALSDTRVELVDGSAIVDSDEFSPGTSVTLMYKGWTVHLLKRGSYRIDSDPAQLWVRRGDAEVAAGPAGLPVAVDSGMTLPFTKVLAAEHTIDQPSDGLTDWAQGRSQSVTADNAISSQISDDPASITDVDAGLDSFTYFPMLGLPSPGRFREPVRHCESLRRLRFIPVGFLFDVFAGIRLSSLNPGGWAGRIPQFAGNSTASRLARTGLRPASFGQSGSE